MSRKLVKHRRFKRDALTIYVYIGEQNLDAAERFLQAVDHDAKAIRDMPGIGALRDFESPALHGLRSLPVTGFLNYLIFYLVTDSEVQLLRIIHGARDLEPALLE